MKSRLAKIIFSTLFLISLGCSSEKKAELEKTTHYRISERNFCLRETSYPDQPGKGSISVYFNRERKCVACDYGANGTLDEIKSCCPIKNEDISKLYAEAFRIKKESEKRNIETHFKKKPRSFQKLRNSRCNYT
jgi:hypothetical protein